MEQYLEKISNQLTKIISLLSGTKEISITPVEYAGHKEIAVRLLDSIRKVESSSLTQY